MTHFTTRFTLITIFKNERKRSQIVSLEKQFEFLIFNSMSAATSASTGLNSSPYHRQVTFVLYYLLFNAEDLFCASLIRLQIYQSFVLILRFIFRFVLHFSIDRSSSCPMWRKFSTTCLRNGSSIDRWISKHSSASGAALHRTLLLNCFAMTFTNTEIQMQD